MRAELGLLKDDYVSARFPYDPGAVERIKNLENRKWDPKQKYWAVHIAHLPQLLGILNLNINDIDPGVREYYLNNWRGVDLVLKIGNCFTTLSGKYPHAAVEEVTSFWVEGAEHTNQYKAGNWDGYKRLLSRSKHPTFPTGLLNRVLEVLDRAKSRYNVVDAREAGEPSLKLKPGNGFKLYDYQSWCTDKAVQDKRGILHMATGSGKTVVAAHLIARLNRPTLFFVHTRDLLYQARERFQQVLGVPIGQIGDNIFDPEPITVATIQTTSRAYGKDYEKFDEEDWDDTMDVSAEERRKAIKELVENAEVVFFDECHHIASATFYYIAMQTEKAYYRYGLSATPYRTDKQDLMIEAALGQRIVKIDSSMLIDLDFLVRPRITFLSLPLADPIRGKPEYHKIYASQVVENAFRNDLIAKVAKKETDQGHTVLVLVQHIKHGQNLLALLPGAEFVQGNDSTEYRTSCLARLRSRDLKVLIATTLADEGLDLPSLDCLILAGAGKSETRALQRIGRVLRKSEGKQRAYVYDFWDEAKFLRDHARKRMEIYQTEDRFDVEIDSSHLKKGTKDARLYT